MKHMLLAGVLLGAIVFGRPSPTQAISIAILPPAQAVDAGATFAASLAIAELGSLMSPSLSTFDIAVSFDPSLVAFDAVTFGDPVLGDQLDLIGLGSITSITPGLGFVRLFELSLDLPAALDAQQAGDFVLANLMFTALGIGESPLTPAINALGDATGQALTATVLPAKVTVIPEPSTAALVGLGLATLITSRRRERGTSAALFVARRLQRNRMK